MTFKNMEIQSATLLMIPKEEWASLMLAQQEILEQLKELKNKNAANIAVKHITAIEFMRLVCIKRSKFDQLVSRNKIKIIKKRRKIYVPVSEVDRYFTDANIP